MVPGTSVLKTSTVVVGVLAVIGFSAFQAVPSVHNRLGWLIPDGTAADATDTSEALRRPAGGGLADVVALVKPAVVSVTSRFTEADPDIPSGAGSRQIEARDRVTPETSRPRAVTSSGAGFFISPDGYVVTNRHVVGGSKTVDLATDDGVAYKALVIASDRDSDIALLKVEGRSDFPFVTLADTAPRIGDQVFAVGNPFGFGGTVTAGIVSALGRNLGADSYDDLIQIDAPINKGNSGGPSFNLAGKVIGINTIIFSPSGGSIGLGFAIPSETVRNVVFQLKTGHAIGRGWFGAKLQPVTSGIANALGLKAARGAMVADIKPDAPATNAGIVPGDVVIAIDGERIKDNYDLSHKLSAVPPGGSVDLVIFREGNERTVRVTLGTPPAPPNVQVDDAPRDHMPPPRGPADFSLKLAPAWSTNGVAVIDINRSGRGTRHQSRRHHS
jgi:serine protease Do